VVGGVSVVTCELGFLRNSYNVVVATTRYSYSEHPTIVAANQLVSRQRQPDPQAVEAITKAQVLPERLLLTSQLS